jgi:hypothetical protein
MTRSFRRLPCLVPFVGIVLASSPAFADEDEHEQNAPAEAPPANTGFQLALRTGIAVPLGESNEGDKMSDVFGVQFPIIADIGAKVIPEIFIGAYVGFGIGGASGNVSDSCSRNGLSCTTTTFRIGAQIQYHIAPAAKVNPWIGYGFGYERSGLSGSKNGDSASVGISGLELAHLMAGVDFRLSNVFGIGPFVDFALGQYSSTSSDSSVNGRSTSTSRDIDKTALHQWFTLGVKFTFFP